VGGTQSSILNTFKAKLTGFASGLNPTRIIDLGATGY
jgi:hypothetical protein